MKTLIKFIRLQILSVITGVLKRYTVYKYGNKSDICIITGYKQNKEKVLSFQTSNTGGLIAFDKKEKSRRLRRFVGENILTIFGPPEENEIAPNIVLYMSPSAIATIGLFNSIKFCRDWKGNSKLGDHIVITYSLS